MAASFEAFGSPVVRKIAVAVLAGSVTYAVTNLTDQPQPTVLTLTVLIGGVFLLAQLLVDFEARQRGVEERLASLERRQADGAREVKGVIAGEIAHISEATRLYDEISRLSPPAIPLDRLGAVAAGLAGMPRSLAPVSAG